MIRNQLDCPILLGHAHLPNILSSKLDLLSYQDQCLLQKQEGRNFSRTQLILPGTSFGRHISVLGGRNFGCTFDCTACLADLADLAGR